MRWMTRALCLGMAVIFVGCSGSGSATPSGGFADGAIHQGVFVDNAGAVSDMTEGNLGALDSLQGINTTSR